MGMQLPVVEGDHIIVIEQFTAEAVTTNEQRQPYGTVSLGIRNQAQHQFVTLVDIELARACDIEIPAIDRDVLFHLCRYVVLLAVVSYIADFPPTVCLQSEPRRTALAVFLEDGRQVVGQFEGRVKVIIREPTPQRQPLFFVTLKQREERGEFYFEFRIFAIASRLAVDNLCQRIQVFEVETFHILIQVVGHSLQRTERRHFLRLQILVVRTTRT